jgi:hypothetical protein
MAQNTLDPKNVNARLYAQISRLLDDLADNDEDIGIRERIAALVAIARIQTLFMGLRKEERPSDRATGSAVRKYSTAFKNAGSGRKARGGRTAPAASEPITDDDFGSDDDAA